MAKTDIILMTKEQERSLRIYNAILHKTIKLIEQYPDAEITIRIKPIKKRKS